MTAPDRQVTVAFAAPVDLTGIFTLDSSLLDGTDVLSGDLPTDIWSYVRQLSITRGRTDALFDVIDPGDCVIELNNHTRVFDPLDTAGPLYGYFEPGKEVVVTAGGVRIFTGQVKDWQVTYDRSGQAIATLTAEDGLAILGRQEFDEWTATASQTADARLTDILNRAEVGWPGGARSFETGATTLQGDLVTWGSNVLNYCQLVTQSELGAFFVDPANVLTFHARSHNAGGTPSVTAADDGSGVVFHGIGIASTAARYYTRVSVDREGGTAQTVTSTGRQIRSTSLSGLLMDSDAQAYNMAEYLHTTLSSTNERVDRLDFILSTEQYTTDELTAILSLDIGALVGVTMTPLGIGDPISTTVQVAGIRHDLTPTSHYLSLTLDVFTNRSAFILDDPVMGVLDGPGVLIF